MAEKAYHITLSATFHSDSCNKAQRIHNLGLIETNADHFLIIKEKKLTDYLAQLS
jgi:hypothetical protein